MDIKEKFEQIKIEHDLQHVMPDLNIGMNLGFYIGLRVFLEANSKERKEIKEFIEQVKKDLTALPF